MDPIEEAKLELTKQWIAKAEADLQSSRVLLAQGHSLVSNASYHADQATEKFIKSFLIWHQVDFPRTHNLTIHLNIVGRVNSGLQRELQFLAQPRLRPIEVRYPGEGTEVTVESARSALQDAIVARDTILRVLEPLMISEP